MQGEIVSRNTFPILQRLYTESEWVLCLSERTTQGLLKHATIQHAIIAGNSYRF